jgi:hypothetical protein
MPVEPINTHFHRKPKQNDLINDYFHSTASPDWHQPIKSPAQAIRTRSRGTELRQAGRSRKNRQIDRL